MIQQGPIQALSQPGLWDSTGPIQGTSAANRTEEQTLDQITNEHHIAPRHQMTWANRSGFEQIIPNPSGYCHQYSYTSENGGDVTVYVYRLGTGRESYQSDPRRRMPSHGGR